MREAAESIFCLPAWSVFGKQSLANDLARTLGRADRFADASPGRDAQRHRHIEVLPSRWAPVSAISAMPRVRFGCAPIPRMCAPTSTARACLLTAKRSD
jgi:hypothetical protein